MLLSYLCPFIYSSILMQDTSLNSTAVKHNKFIIYFLLLWALLNAVQAFTLEIHADEAYYWVYSRFLDWGYYDHPPMVAVYIKAGYSLLHNEFGARLFTVITTTASLYLMWVMLKRYRVDAINFILVISGIFVFHIYGFTTTPDAPLLFFTVLFFYFYQQYVEKDSFKLAIILGAVVACLLYSKYHGILLLIFTLAANIKLLKRGSFYAIVLLALALYAPHIIWQANHGFPSLSYHLSERSAEGYNFEYTYIYPLGQLLMAGPLIGWLLFYKGFKAKSQDVFTRTLRVNAIGILAFFFLTSFKGEVQLHWTLIAYVPLSMMVLISFTQSGVKPAWFNRLAIINVAMIVILRVCIIIAFPPLLKVDAVRSFFGFKEWAKLIREKAGDNYVIFNEGFQNPSKYNFYNNTTKGFDYDARYYRRTQYDIWPIEDSLQHKRAYVVCAEYPVKGLTTDSLIIGAGKWYMGWVDDIRTYQKIDFQVPSYKEVMAPGASKDFELSFTNPYAFPISFSNQNAKHKVFLEACVFKKLDQVSLQQADSTFNNISLKTGETGHFKFNVTAPKQPGKYELIFSIRTEPFVGGRNNKIINITVE
ncbi:ArnT family glycosyltransferase [Mucilaginibacter celer]|uniref:Glycosyltransferase RgtA/B/C/D-like domain-containing protein n=1 Tax=Mucilaginibacter celer TaxID=2305508 RepID=A0A494VSG2_9SPHI|nr:glycosyltransferase family 39 protein [Mucilaginibacter celer]AYL97379.1 hypothetical protein HYN43_019635 [Mucilaginibacter celer]